jgi:hypothetical protein
MGKNIIRLVRVRISYSTKVKTAVKKGQVSNRVVENVSPPVTITAVLDEVTREFKDASHVIRKVCFELDMDHRALGDLLKIHDYKIIDEPDLGESFAKYNDE